MQILPRYLRREALTHAGLGLGIFTFVIFLRHLGQLLQIVVQSSSARVLEAVALLLPTALIFTVPMAVLVGLLAGLSRMAADNEILALRANGWSTWRLVRPLMAVILGAAGLALFTSLWLTPWANRRLLDLEASLRNSQIAYAVHPRVFIESIPKVVMYVGDTRAGGSQWRQVLVADMTHPQAPMLTLAARGRIVPDGPGALQLHLAQGISYRPSRRRPAALVVSSFLSNDVPLPLPAAGPPHLNPPALPTGALLRGFESRNWLADRIEFYRRLALALACVCLPLLGISLGLARRQEGKAAGYMVTLLLVMVYYVLFISGIALAQHGHLPPWLGAGGADLLFFAAGVWLLARGDRVPSGHSPRLGLPAWGRPRWRRQNGAASPWFRRRNGGAGRRPPLMPFLLDGYILLQLLGFVALVLGGFLLLTIVFTFFELLGHILHSHASLAVVGRYLLFLTPQMLFLTAPLALLVGTLLAFGLMSKANEITALKSCGVGVHRLLPPLLGLALLLAAGQFALEQTVLPRANRLQNSLLARIKGGPAQTFRSPAYRWVFGRQGHVYYFRFFDSGANRFDHLQVFTFSPRHFRLRREIAARSAYWDARLRGWVLENGWQRQLRGARVTAYQRFRVASFRTLGATPAYFKTRTPEASQMNYGQLSRYVSKLAASGYDVNGLRVQLEQKIAYPLISVIMVLLAFPYALSVGRRGAVGGLMLALVVAMGYWFSAGLLQALGNLDQMPAMLAAWAPDAAFAMAGVYLILKVPT